MRERHSKRSEIWSYSIGVQKKTTASALSLFTKQVLRSWAKLSKSKFILLSKLKFNNQCPIWMALDAHYWVQRIVYKHIFIMQKQNSCAHNLYFNKVHQATWKIFLNFISIAFGFCRTRYDGFISTMWV